MFFGGITGGKSGLQRREGARLPASPPLFSPYTCYRSSFPQKVTQLIINTYSYIKMLMKPLVDICRYHKWLFHSFGGKLVANFFYFLYLHMLVRLYLHGAT